VRVESIEASPSTVIETLADWPAWSVPEPGEKSTLPTRLDGSEIDHDTGPPDAVMVSVVAPSALSTTVVGDTATVPGVTAGADEEGWVGVGDGDFDEELTGEGDREGVADFVAAGEVAGRVAAGELAWVPWLG
jgi:hypothetical protein